MCRFSACRLPRLAWLLLRRYSRVRGGLPAILEQAWVCKPRTEAKVLCMWVGIGVTGKWRGGEETLVHRTGFVQRPSGWTPDLVGVMRTMCPRTALFGKRSPDCSSVLVFFHVASLNSPARVESPRPMLPYSEFQRCGTVPGGLLGRKSMP